MRGDVCGHALSPPLSTRGRNANRQFLRNAWYTCAQLRYLVSHTWYTRAQLYIYIYVCGTGYQFLWKTILNWAVQPRLNTLSTLLAGQARTYQTLSILG